MAEAREQAAAGPEDAALREKRKTFRELRLRSLGLRDTIQAAIKERRDLDAQIEALAAELGLPFKGKGAKGAAAG